MDKYQPEFKVLKGEYFPDMILNNQESIPIRIREIPSKYTAIYFYPQDDTPTCTKEACGLRDHYEILQKHDCVIVGISPDDEKSHQRFIQKHELNFDLLVDTNHELADVLGIWGLKFTFGREYMGLHRVSYLLDANKKIKSIIYPVESGHHADQILQCILQS